MNNTELIFYTIMMARFDQSAYVYQPQQVTKATIATAGIIQEIILGPFRGKEVTLLTEKESSAGNFIINNITERLKEPLILRRISKHIQLPLGETRTNSSTKSEEYLGKFTSDSALIIVSTGDAQWRPFHDFGKRMTKIIILISLSTSCQIKALFETPLLSKTTFVTLFCLSKRKEGNKLTFFFRMWCWRPYASGKKTVDLGVWNPESFRSLDHLFIDRFDDMSKKYMFIEGNTEDMPLFYNETDGTLNGLNHKIVQECALSFKFNLNFTTSNEFIWHEMLQKLKRGELDLFVNSAMMTPDRYEDYDLLRPYHQEAYGLMLRSPPPLPRWKNIIYPFSWIVWIAVAISMMSTSVMYHIIYHDHEKSFPNNALSVLQTMLSNSMKRIPEQWRVRIFLLIWWIASWLLHASYTCNLIAVLTVPVSPTKIQTAQELAQSYNRLCMLDYGDFVPDALRTSTQPVLASLGRVLDMVPMNFSLNYVGEEACIERVLKGTHSHIDGISFLKIIYNELGHSSTAYDLREKLYPGYVALLATKNSPWSYKISRSIQRMIEAGLIEKWYKDTMTILAGLRRDGNPSRSSQLQALTVDHLQSSFYLQIGGSFISTLALVWELFSGPKVCST